MKRLIYFYTMTLFVLTVLPAYAQSTEKMSYQTVVRDANNDLVKDTQVGMQISILQSTSNGSVVYEETQTPTTNANGLATVEIGNGTVISGDLSTIDWSAGPYFIKTEIDPAGGTGYTITGTSQLLSVPYALYAKTADNIFGGINYDEINNIPVSTNMDSSYIVEMDKSDKDFINFGAFTNFTNSSSWAVIERVKMPVGTGADGGWHFFRGYAWQDKEGDIAISIKSNNVYAWLRKGGWVSISYDQSFNEDQWYDICFQYDASTQTLELYVDGTLAGQQTGIAPQDDSGNTNNMLWGGQENNGSLYGESSIVIANQVWLQRVLTSEEIQNYKGHMDSDPAIFFSSEISFNSITDNSGNGHDGTNGNTPVYSVVKYNNGIVFPDGSVQTTAATITSKHYVGEFFGGGIVFWVDETGEHGLVCSKYDLSTGVRWYAGTYGNTRAKGDGIYAGKINTAIIVAAQVAIGDDNNTYAARICNNMTIIEHGKVYSDWYLPSKEELIIMFKNKEAIDSTAKANGGNVLSPDYWSSTEYNDQKAWVYNPRIVYKNANNSVRAVRAF